MHRGGADVIFPAVFGKTSFITEGHEKREENSLLLAI